MGKAVAYLDLTLVSYFGFVCFVPSFVVHSSSYVVEFSSLLFVEFDNHLIVALMLISELLL